MVFLGNVLNIQSSKSKEESSKRIVIHLGSSNLLIGLILLGGYFNALGLNTDSIPISIPAVVARRRRIKKESVNNHVALDTDDIDEWVGVIQPFVKHRMKLNLLKYPNMMSQVVAYNEIEQPQIIQVTNY